MSNNQFSNRWGVVLASLGMAIGAGNLWRFPRLAGQYGGAFIILWMLFLLVWSIPLLMSEFGMGKSIRKSVIGCFGIIGGKLTVWMGFFVTVCTLGIAFYYSVVVAWSIRFLGISLINSGVRFDETDMERHWNQISNGSWWTIFTFLFVILGAVFVLSKGIKNGSGSFGKS